MTSLSQNRKSSNLTWRIAPPAAASRHECSVPWPPCTHSAMQRPNPHPPSGHPSPAQSLHRFACTTRRAASTCRLLPSASAHCFSLLSPSSRHFSPSGLARLMRQTTGCPPRPSDFPVSSSRRFAASRPSARIVPTALNCNTRSTGHTAPRTSKFSDSIALRFYRGDPLHKLQQQRECGLRHFSMVVALQLKQLHICMLHLPKHPPQIRIFLVTPQ